MRHSLLFIFIFIFAVTGTIAACNETSSFGTTPGADGDITDVSETDTAPPDCSETPVSCNDDADCDACDGDGWQCCEGYCAKECITPDGDEEKDIEYNCPATGQPCSSWQDCYLICPVDDQQYVCEDGVCAYQGATDGDEDLPDAEPEIPEDTEPEAEPDPEPEIDNDPLIDQDDECYTGLANRQPVLEPIEGVEARAGETVRIPIVASDPDPCDVLSYICNQCPTGAAIDTNLSPPEFIWEIPANFGPQIVLASIQVIDSGTPPWSAYTTVQIAVLPDDTNHPPEIPDIADRELLVGDRLEYSFTVSDPEGDPLTLTPVDLPDWATMNLGANNLVQVSINASSLSNPRQATLSFTVSDNHNNSSDGSAAVAVHPRNQADDCNRALHLHHGDRYYGSNADRSQDSTARPPCVEYPATGPNMFFAVEQPGNSGLRIRVEALDQTHDPVLSIWSAGCAACVTGDDIHTAGEYEELALTPLTGGDGAERIVVVDSYDANAAGPFMLVVSPDTQEITGGDLCTACENQYGCGYEANCLEFYSGSVLLERACGRNCADHDDCLQGYICREHVISGTNLEIKQCVPDYSERHEARTCAALAELGNACTDTSGSSDEGECGADDNMEVDDADCSTFRIDGSDQSLCTVKCGGDGQCPAGFSCQEWQVFGGYGYCLPD